jgi:hypothetical protein
LSWVEIETDYRYLQDEWDYAQLSPWCQSRRWPEVSSIFERKLAAKIRKRSVLRLDRDACIRVLGLAAQVRDSVITLDVQTLACGRVEVSVVEMVRHRTVMPPITSDDPGGLECALIWFAARALPFRLSVSPDNLFWIPIG